MRHDISHPAQWAGLALLTALLAMAPGAHAAEKPEILDAGYPRAFFFRSSEAAAARGIPFAKFEATFSQLDGIMGKAQDEEIPGRSSNIDYFTRFKLAHPTQAVLLHFNGNARDPRFHGERYFAGHWLYYNGCRVLEPLPAAGGEVTIRVQNPRLFKVDTGRYGNSNEDLAICAIGPDGKPDWRRCEQVQLLAIDVAGKTLKIRRGAYGTKPLAFPKGSHIAAHASEGPWGKQSNLLWHYNFSTTCPRDAQGRTCAEVLAAELAEWFAPNGALHAFDGLEFDVSNFERGGGARGGRGFDADGDGRRDDGVIGGLNVYGLGQTAFHAALRQALGEGRIIQADGASAHNQRSFGILNGIESEGFPFLNDYEMVDWSGGLNRHLAWRAWARPPAFNYINHKFMERGGGDAGRATVPFSTHRLVFAAAMFTDAALCCSYLPTGAPGELAPIWDELIMGAERRKHWLGRPVGETVRLGQRAPDLLAGAGTRMDAAFAARWRSAGAAVASAPDGELKLAGRRAVDGRLSATLTGLNLPQGDLLVYLTLRGEPRAGYPASVPRQAWLACEREDKKPAGPLTPERIMCWVGEKKLLAGFYFRDVGPAAVRLTLDVEGSEPVYVSGLTVHNAPDAMARRFEHGLVLANPSTRDYTFKLEELAPGAAWRRLKGTAPQDPRTNNGAAVGPTVTLGARDGLFLVAAPRQ